MNIELIDNKNIELFIKYYKKGFESIDLIAVQKAVSQNLADIVNKVDNPELLKDLLLHEIGDHKLCFFHIVAKFGSPEDLKKVLTFIGEKNINKIDVNHYTALHHCAIVGAVENVRMLISHGANINAKSSDETRNWLPIHYACKYAHKEVVIEFINARINKNVTTSFGLGPLHVACEYGNYELASYLVALGCNLNAETVPENHNLTPLHYAIMINSLKIVELLIEAGADRYKVNSNGEDALIMATKRNHHEIVSYLIAKGVVAMLEDARAFAKHKNHKESLAIIEIYLKIRDDIFNKSSLIKIYQNLHDELTTINVDNYKNYYLNIFSPAKISPYFLINIRKKIGIFNKTRTNLAQYNKYLGLDNLATQINRIENLIKFQEIEK